MSDDAIEAPTEVDGESGEESSMLGLVDAWESSREPFDEWVQSVSRAFYETEHGIESSAQLLDTTPGELGAVLNLAAVDEERLSLLAEDVPPKTTWLAFAEADEDETEAGIEALDDMKADDSAHRVVKQAIREERGPTPESRVKKLQGEVFFHMSTKAKQYDVLSGKTRGFLYQMGQLKKSGNELSDAQADWAKSALETMVEQGVVKRDSPDDDQEHCDKVLDALGE